MADELSKVMLRLVSNPAAAENEEEPFSDDEESEDDFKQPQNLKNSSLVFFN